MKKLHSTFLLTKLSALLMKAGKKKLVLKMVLKGLPEMVGKNTCALTSVFHQLQPVLETRKVRKGSKYYDVPFPIKKARALSLLLRWTTRAISSSSTRGNSKGKSAGLSQKVHGEFIDLINGELRSNSVKESKALRSKVAANIIYSHFRW